MCLSSHVGFAIMRVCVSSLMISALNMRHAVNTTRSTTIQTPFEHEVAERLVAALQLEVTAEEIAPEAPLFGEGLGLDSIDALEIALFVGRDYGVALRSEDPDNKKIFSSLWSLCAFVQANRTAG